MPRNKVDSLRPRTIGGTRHRTVALGIAIAVVAAVALTCAYIMHKKSSRVLSKQHVHKLRLAECRQKVRRYDALPVRERLERRLKQRVADISSRDDGSGALHLTEKVNFCFRVDLGGGSDPEVFDVHRLQEVCPRHSDRSKNNSGGGGSTKTEKQPEHYRSLRAFVAKHVKKVSKSGKLSCCSLKKMEEDLEQYRRTKLGSTSLQTVRKRLEKEVRSQIGDWGIMRKLAIKSSFDNFKQKGCRHV